MALSVLDVKQPAVWRNDDTPDVASHWCLARYLLDGHHKVVAAAAEGRPVRLLSFLAVDEGISSTADIETLLTVL